MMINRKTRRVIVATLAGAGIIVPVQAKLWTPQAPAVVRAESLKDIEVAKALLPGFCLPMVVGAVAGGSAPTIVAAGAMVTVDGTTIAVPYYAGLAVNDIAFIWVNANSTPTIGTITNFTSLTQISNGTFGARLAWKRLLGSESGTASCTATGAGTVTGIMIGVRGVFLTGTPYEGANTANGSGTAQTSATIITTQANTLGLRFGAAASGSAVAPPSTWTELVDDDDGGAGSFIEVDYKTLATAATEGASTRTLGFSGLWVVQTLAALPAA